MVNTCTDVIIYNTPKDPIQFIREEVDKAHGVDLNAFLDQLWEQNKQTVEALMDRSRMEDPSGVLSLFGRAVQKKAYKGEEIAEALQAEAVFTLATDKKPIVATSGCYPCIAVGGYEPIYKLAFVIHFASIDEVQNSGSDLLDKIQVPAKYVLNNYNLGIWFSGQKYSFKKGTLSAERLKLLQQFPGWASDFKKDRWQSAYNLLLKFCQREGHSQVKRDHIEENFKLGGWIQTQRKAYKAGKMPQERIDLLEKLAGWTWDTRKELVDS